MKTAALIPARYYVATYGNMGLDVSFFHDRKDFAGAIKDAESSHPDTVDSFTYGDVPAFMRKPEPVAPITFPVFTGKLSRNGVSERHGVQFAETTVDGITFRAFAERDHDMLSKPDENQAGFWPSLDPNDPGFLGHDKTFEECAIAQRQAETVMAAFKAGRAFYVGVFVQAFKGSHELTRRYANALWGIECNWPGKDHSYLSEVASELASEVLPDAKARLAALIAELQGG